MQGIQELFSGPRQLPLADWLFQLISHIAILEAEKTIQKVLKATQKQHNIQ